MRLFLLFLILKINKQVYYLKIVLINSKIAEVCNNRRLSFAR
jgi:hypothetical protein